MDKNDMDKDDKEKKALEVLKNRISLCSRGITLPEDSNFVLYLQSAMGFGGPRGRTYYLGSTPGDHSSQISLLIFPKDHYLAKYALPSRWWNEDNKSFNGSNHILYVNKGMFLEKIPIIWKGKLPNGRRVTQISRAKFHAYHTYCIGNSWKCKYIERDEGCKYCTLSLSVNKLNIPSSMSNEENIAYLKLAMANNPIRSVTISSGTIGSPENTGRQLLSLARLIRKETGLSVHVQVEPIFDKKLLQELSEVADTIGIFIEFFDEKVRQEICPGKFRLFSQDDYRKSWEMAVSCFGWGKVGTTNIIGFDEDYETVLRGIERAAGIGVFTSILFLRVGSPKLGNIIPSYIGREDELLHLHRELGSILVKNSLDNLSTKKSGCMGCLGCHSTREAVTWARAALTKPGFNALSAYSSAYSNEPYLT